LESAFGKLAARVGETANGPLNWWGDAALFSNAGPGDQELYLARAGETVNLSPAKGDDLQPAWSPDGQTVAFSSARNGNFDIYLLACPKLAGNCAGNKPIQLTSSRGYDEWPAWSPNGQKIAFVSDRDGNVEIYVMDASGANQQRLSQHPADDWPATWSPDGRSLAFASNRDGNWNIYLMAPNGENIRRLTNDPGDEREPVWSPDGQRLAFAANKNGNWDIYTLLVPLNQPTEVPSTAWSHVAATATDERYPAWLP
jgi:TolB protein